MSEGEKFKPVGWFNPWNDYHGYQQVAPEFEGKRGTLPLYDKKDIATLTLQLEAALERAVKVEEERDGLQDRLEMRHAFDGDGNRIEVEPGSIPDGIECRDATIGIQDSIIDRLRAENTSLREALATSMTAIDDWLNLYASELCDENRVAEAKRRVHENGTLFYIATIQEANRAALKTGAPSHD